MKSTTIPVTRITVERIRTVDAIEFDLYDVRRQLRLLEIKERQLIKELESYGIHKFRQ